MIKRRYIGIPQKMFSLHLIALSIVGIALNILIPRLVMVLGLPLYLDNIGSILVAALGGALPGMAVAFLSKLLNFGGEANDLYFGILTIFIAWAASEFSKRGWFKKIGGLFSAAFCFMIIGGAAGSVIGWLLYGGTIAEGTASSSFAFWLFNHGFPAFWAQFTGDMIVDVADKLLTVAAVGLALKYYPKKFLYDRYPLSYLYDRSPEETEKVWAQQHSRYRSKSIHARIVALITLSLVGLSLTATVVSGVYYGRTERQQYNEVAYNAAIMALQKVKGDSIASYLSDETPSADYEQTKQQLTDILTSSNRVMYLYMYQIREDGCHVVFDLDTDGLTGSDRGEVISFDPGFAPYLNDLINGKDIPPVMTDGKYGWLISAYVTVHDSSGATVAYIGADTSAAQCIKNILTYIIELIYIEFGISMAVVLCAVWYAQRHVVDPINTLVNQSLAFDAADPETWQESDVWKNRRIPHTGDEIETLYHTTCTVEKNIALYVTQLRESERRMAKANELEKKNLELEKAVQRADAVNAAKADFYSRMSHDMRTPMNGIIGLVALSENENDPTVLHENIQKIGESGNYLLGLINDTLDMSKLESKKLVLNPTVIGAQQMFESLLSMAKPSVNEKNITLTINNRGVRMDVYILADWLRLRQVFMNLFSNAVKFTPPGGAIIFTLENRGEEETVVHDRFILQDSGIGMSKEFLENGLFRPFSQEQNVMTAQYAGSGLGLAIVKNLVDLMHGSITAQSEPGDGTTFILDLDFPLVPAEQAQKDLHAVKEQEDLSPLKGKHILLCEDNNLNAEIATRLLERAGMKVTAAKNGEEAVDRFLSLPSCAFDAILMDIHMPVMNGLAAAKTIRACDRSDAKTIPIIAMTANAYSEDREQTRLAGMNAHLSKPIDVQALYRTLLEFLTGDSHR